MRRIRWVFHPEKGCHMGDGQGALVKNTKRRFKLDPKQDPSDSSLQWAKHHQGDRAKWRLYVYKMQMCGKDSCPELAPSQVSV